MIRFTKGDILQDESEALVNTVNCVGVMGRGIALQFKKAFPKNFVSYKIACDHGEVTPGRMFITSLESLTNPKYIINFPTKRHWRGKSKISDIREGLDSLKKNLVELGIKSIAIPPLGSGLGGLNWRDVKYEIETSMSDLEIEIYVYEPGEAPDAQAMTKSIDPPEMTTGRATLVTLTYRYLTGLLDPFITLLELHKLMYFMQEAGEPLRLRYRKHHFGPYAENLRHVLNRIEGHLVSGYADGGDAPNKQIELVPGAYEDAMEALKGNPESNERFRRVSELVDGFESPAGMELLATVHWLIKKDNVKSKEESVKLTYLWNERKKRFTERQIELTYDRLIKLGWG